MMHTRSFSRWLSIGLLLVIAGCSKTDTPATSTGPASTTTSADAGNAPAAAGSQPAPYSAPEATASTSAAKSIPARAATPSSSASPAAAAAPAPLPPVEIEPGTVLTVTIDQAIGTKENSAGDRFAASLAEPVTVDGREVLPVGTRATGTITQAESAGRVKGGAVLSLTIDSITLHGKKYSVETSSFEEAGKGRGKRTAIGAGGGAAFGAIVGALAGGGKGAAIGALAGGGAGTAGTAFTGKRDFSIPAETRLHFKLVHRLTVSR